MFRAQQKWKSIFTTYNGSTTEISDGNKTICGARYCESSEREKKKEEEKKTCPFATSEKEKVEIRLRNVISGI